MNRRLVLAATVALAAIAAAPGAQTPAPQAPSAPVIAAPRIEKIVDGVFVAIRPEPPGVFVDANSIFLVGPDDVIVVDTNATPSSARASLAALKKLSPKPVRAVINTHWHQDHINGNQVYREAFPKAEFIAHANVGQNISMPGVSNRAGLMSAMTPLVEEMRLSLDQRKGMGGGPLTDEERASHDADIERAQRFIAETGSLASVTPGRLVTDRLTLTQGTRSIEIFSLGRGHSPADLVVHLPRERVVIAGDLITAPVPIISGTAVPSEFVKALQALLALAPAVIVPGHGEVVRQDQPVRDQIQLLESILHQVRTAVAGGATLQQVRVMVNIDELRRGYVGTSTFRGYLFDLFAKQPGVTAAFREVTAPK